MNRSNVHRVREGERLTEIAALHGVALDDVIAANPHKPLRRLSNGAIVFADLRDGEEIAVGLGAHVSASFCKDCPPGGGQTALLIGKSVECLTPRGVIELYQMGVPIHYVSRCIAPAYL